MTEVGNWRTRPTCKLDQPALIFCQYKTFCHLSRSLRCRCTSITKSRKRPNSTQADRNVLQTQRSTSRHQLLVRYSMLNRSRGWHLYGVRINGSWVVDLELTACCDSRLPTNNNNISSDRWIASCSKPNLISNAIFD